MCPSNQERTGLLNRSECKEMGDLTGNEVAMSNKSVLFLAVSLYFWVNFFLSDRRVRG